VYENSRTLSSKRECEKERQRGRQSRERERERKKKKKKKKKKKERLSPVKSASASIPDMNTLLRTSTQETCPCCEKEGARCNWA